MSRELDAQIAEKIMGWTRIGKISLGYYDACEIGVPPNTSLGCFDSIPPYSSSIGDAWRVVEKITEIPQTQEARILANNTRFMHWWENCPLWAYPGEDAAEEICKAALEIVNDPRTLDDFIKDLKHEQSD